MAGSPGRRAGVGCVAAACCRFSLRDRGVLADVRVTRDLGGEVSSYIHKFESIRDSGERLVIDGPCLSACTLFTAIIPRDQVCVTRRAVLGFHAGIVL